MDLDPIQFLIIGAIAVMIFGGRLPEVSKKIGRGLGEFKRGWDNIRNEFHSALDVTGALNPSSTTTSTSSSGLRRHRLDDLDDSDEPTAPKFEPPPRPIRSALP